MDHALHHLDLGFAHIALALVRREVSPGSTVFVGDEAIAAQIVELPFG